LNQLEQGEVTGYVSKRMTKNRLSKYAHCIQGVQQTENCFRPEKKTPAVCGYNLKMQEYEF
jgi:hypothetical protein